ncbi:hypothetical protein VNO78_20736 [Psophocarpus tetragonolobus]|uniref:Uncharacterized protein n=1 Tax=Psophocarpus tetragonolobus TaxID=3891 RepID=A0AAN9XH08_PSOTE
MMGRVSVTYVETELGFEPLPHATGSRMLFTRLDKDSNRVSFDIPSFNFCVYTVIMIHEALLPPCHTAYSRPALNILIFPSQGEKLLVGEAGHVQLSALGHPNRLLHVLPFSNTASSPSLSFSPR